MRKQIERVSRRAFGKTIAVAAAVLQPAAPPASAQEPDEDGLSAADRQEVDAKLADTLRKYGDRLTDDQKDRLRGILTNHQRMLAQIRTFRLENGDTPASTLKLATGNEVERSR